MPIEITIQAGSVTVQADLNDSPTAKKIASALPIQAKGRRWGEEIYFAIPVDAELEPDARAVLKIGELGYWPVGNAFCMFFGRTPASQGDEIRAASEVNIIGRMTGDLAALNDVPNGVTISIKTT